MRLGYYCLMGAESWDEIYLRTPSLAACPAARCVIEAHPHPGRKHPVSRPAQAAQALAGPWGQPSANARWRDGVP